MLILDFKRKCLPVIGELEGKDALKSEGFGGGERRKKRGGHESLHEVDLLRSGQSGASGDT